jgi:hypothetical protein
MRLDVVRWAEAAFVRGRRLRAEPECQNDPHRRYRDTWSVFERKPSHIGCGVDTGSREQGAPRKLA